MEINVLTPSEAFYWLATIAATNGQPSTPRGIKTLEVQNVTCSIAYPYIFPIDVHGRDLRPSIGAVEALQLIGQVATPEIVTGASNAMAAYMDDGIFAGAYGQRIYGQLAAIEQTLQSDGHTRQAVASIYSGPIDLMTWNGERPMLDIPCTLTLQFMWAQGTLSLRTSMRSNDVWLGLPYDLFQFINLQMAMADALGVPCGPYIHTVGSLHAYAKDLENIMELAAPSQPESHEKDYKRRFGGKTIGEISETARAILIDKVDNSELTAWERYLWYALHGKAKK